MIMTLQGKRQLLKPDVVQTISRLDQTSRERGHLTHLQLLNIQGPKPLENRRSRIQPNIHFR